MGVGVPSLLTSGNAWSINPDAGTVYFMSLEEIFIESGFADLLLQSSQQFGALEWSLVVGVVVSILFGTLFYFILGYYRSKRSYHQSDHKLNRIVESSPMAIYSVNKKGIVTGFWNRTAEKMFGWTAEEVTGQYLPHITNEPPIEYQKMIESVQSGKTYQNVVGKRFRKDGSELYARFYASPASNGQKEEGDILVMVEEVTEMKATEKALQAEKQFTDTILKSQPGLFYLIDEQRRLVRWNQNVNEFFDMSDNQLKGMKFLDLFVEDEHLKVLEAIHSSITTGKLEVEAVVRSRGKLHDFYITGTLMNVGRERYIVGTGMNITERNKTRDKLLQSIKEKELLLSEVHHRVKNNLAIISNLIDFQLMDIEEGMLSEILRETQNRIYSIAGVHEMLYDVKNFSQISIKKYLNKLFERIFTLFNQNQRMINFDLMVKVEYLNINQAIPLGLLLTELITNSFKHGFEKDQAGLITIEITGGPDLVRIVYKDNGKGFEKHEFENSNSTGFILVRSLLKQLKSEYSVQGEQGFELSFSFRMQMRGSQSTLT